MINNICKDTTQSAVVNEHERQLSKLRKIGENINGKKESGISIVPHLIYCVHDNADIYPMISEICRILKHYNLIDFDGASNFIELQFTEDMLHRPEETEELLIEKIINSSVMTDCFKGVCVLNFTYVNLPNQSLLAKILIDFIRNMSAVIKFILLFRFSDRDKKFVQTFLTSNLNIFKVVFESISEDECIQHADALFEQSGVTMQAPAIDFIHNYLFARHRMSLIRCRDDIKSIVNKLLYTHLADSSGSVINNETVLEYILKLDEDEKEKSSICNGIGFEGGDS